MKYVFVLFLTLSCGKSYETERFVQRIEESSESIRIISHCSTSGLNRYYKLFIGDNGFIGVYDEYKDSFFDQANIGESDVVIKNKKAPKKDCFKFK